MLIGQVVVDIACSVPNLPPRGGDVHVEHTSIDIGGCGPNIALALTRLGLGSINLFPLGSGMWNGFITQRLGETGIDTQLAKPHLNNGWTLAMVEPDGERTFVSTTGVASEWTAGDLAAIGPLGEALVYINGYEMSGPSAGTLLDWLERETGATVVFDPGPRIGVIGPEVLKRLYRLGALFTVNRQEIGLLAPGLSPHAGAAALSARTGAPVVVRLDRDGALFFDPKGDEGAVSGFRARVVDTIGAGDGHTAGLMAGMASGLGWREALFLGNAIAAAVVEKSGGMTAPSRSELLERPLHPEVSRRE